MSYTEPFKLKDDKKGMLLWRFSVNKKRHSDFAVLRNALLATNKVVTEKGTVTYGEIEVVVYESNCPVG